VGHGDEGPEGYKVGYMGVMLRVAASVGNGADGQDVFEDESVQTMRKTGELVIYI